MYRVAEITVPILLFMWSNKRKAKKEREEQNEENRKERDRQHEENKKNITEVKTQLEFCPPHLHTEEKGVLRVEGLYPKKTKTI